MDYRRIQELLDKYWEGETSLDEEKLLKTYFNGEEVAADLQQYAPLFQYLNTAELPTLDDQFDQKLMASLEEIDSTPTKAPIQIKRPRLIHWVMRAAAVFALLSFAFFLQQQLPSEPAKKQGINWEAKETLSPEEAWRQTKAALELVSNKLNKGSKGASKGMSKVSTATKIIKN